VSYFADVPNDMGNVDHSNVDSGDDSLPLIVDEADEIEQRPGVPIETSQVWNFSDDKVRLNTLILSLGVRISN